jgi:tetratricopeptide (TPR) repeat protein
LAFQRHEPFAQTWSSRRTQVLLVCIGLIAATLLAYARVGSFGFVDYDDPAIVYQNPRVKDGFSVEGVVWAFRDVGTYYWQPAAWLSHMLDCELFGLDPGPPHLVNAALHSLNGALLFLILLYATGSFWRSALVAAIFALHPLRVESVAWISERRDVLCGLFSLLTVLAYIRYTVRPESRGRFAAVLAAFWLALMSKPMAITLPVVLLLMDHWPLRRTQQGGWRKLVREKIPLFASALLIIVVTAIGNSGKAISFDILPLRWRIASAFGGYLGYMERFVWPRGLAFFYPHRLPATGVLVLSGLAVVLSSAFAIRSFRRRPYAFVGWWWFVIMLGPVIGLMQVGGQHMADRFTYLPLIGLSIAVVWLISGWLETRPKARTACAAAAVAAVLVLGALTWRQTGYWSDKFSLYRRVLAVTENNERMWFFYGKALAKEGRNEEAAKAFQEAIRLEPGRGDDHEELGLLFMRQGKSTEALREFREVIRLEPENVGAMKYLGLTLIQAGQAAEATEYLQRAFRLAPHDGEVRQLLMLANTMNPVDAPAGLAVARVPNNGPAANPADAISWATLSSDEALEIGILLALISVSAIWPAWARRGLGAIESRLAYLARHPVQAITVAVLLPMVLRLLWLPIYPIPEPQIADEFGYLLQADTFAAGSLTNPPHPMREHFESSYILQEPTYTSYYPPGNGLSMAWAVVLGVSPWFAVWLAMGLMCACFYWMLAGWMSPRWALVGALLAAMRFSVLSVWMNSYWGGAVAAIGGALAFGALPRVLRSGRAVNAAILGLGIGIVSQTRPYEGLLISIPIALYLTIKLIRHQTLSWKRRLAAVAAPLLAVLLFFGVFTAYYNWRVTGNPLLLPYQLYAKEYGVPQSFYWQEPLPPGKSLRLPELEANYRWQLHNYNAGKSLGRLVSATSEKARAFWGFFVEPVWTLPFLALPLVWFHRRTRFLLVAAAVVAAGVLLYPFFFPHYLGPVCAVLIALIVDGIRRIRLWRWRGRPVGAGIAFAVLVTSALGIVITPAGGHLLTDRQLVSRNTPRARILKTLAERGGKHLIIVRYGPNHKFHNGLINNDADIDRSPVVWARDLGPARNEELIRYYPDRSIWTYEADVWPVRLEPLENGTYSFAR